MLTAAAPQPQDEAALKRNTDCLYFLASPLTCKKGNKCDYRHSDIARVNPRDCWFWLNGNCLNPKCAFRHPPLDGLLGTQMPTFTGSDQTPTAHVESAASKSTVPCKFFQSGFCLKGDRCPFLHKPNSMQNKASSAVEPSTSNQVKMIVHEKKVPPTNKGKPVEDSRTDSQVSGEVEPAIVRNELSTMKRITSNLNELPHYINLPVSYRNLASWSNRVHHHHLDEPGMMETKDAGDNSREPSPGFDVLVDGEVRDSDFYLYGMSREYEAGNAYDMNHLTDYNIIADDNNGRHKDLRSYDSNGYRNGQYGLEQKRASRDRMSKRRPYVGDNSRGEVDRELGLRHFFARSEHHIGLMHVINDEDRSYHGLHRNRRHEAHFSSRLEGRIRLAERSSSSSSPSDRGMIRDNEASSFEQGRIQKGGSSNGWKKHRVRRENNSCDFDSPKSLAELKKRKYLAVDGDNPSFDGPKPLKEILKRKRGEAVGNGNSSTGGDIIIEDVDHNFFY